MRKIVMQEGRCSMTFMQEIPDQTAAELEAEKLHEIVDEMLRPFGRRSPRSSGYGLLGGVLERTPFDTSRPNEHDSKTDFKREFDVVNACYENIREVIESFVDVEEGSGGKEMRGRLRPIIDAKMRADASTESPNTAFEMLTKNAADIGGFTSSLLIMLEFLAALKSRRSELLSQQDKFWTVSNRPPDYYARAIALRLAKVFLRETGQRPTFGTSGETGESSTSFARALQATFDLLGIKSGIRTHAEWAIREVTLDEPSQRVNALRALTDFIQPPPGIEPDKIVSAFAVKRRDE